MPCTTTERDVRGPTKLALYFHARLPVVKRAQEDRSTCSDVEFARDNNSLFGRVKVLLVTPTKRLDVNVSPIRKLSRI